jgi:hypothetical protein
LRGGWSNARQQLHHPKPRHPIGRVLAPAQDTDHVFDVRGLEELTAAVLYKRNVAAAELNLELGAMVGGAEQHRLGFQHRPCFPGLEDLLNHVPSLSSFVRHGGQQRLLL